MLYRLRSVFAVIVISFIVVESSFSLRAFGALL